MMTDIAAQLLSTFDTLSPQEQHELLIALLRRHPELVDTLISEEELVSMADELFQRLDAEEAADAPPAR